MEGAKIAEAMGTALAARRIAPPMHRPESCSQRRLGLQDQSKGRDQRRSNFRDRNSPARSYGVVGFSALLGGPGQPGDVATATCGPDARCRPQGFPCRMLLPPDGLVWNRHGAERSAEPLNAGLDGPKYLKWS